MKISLKKIVNSNIFHIHIISMIVLIILITVGLIALRYYVEGEGAMPYEIEKISIISSSESVEIEDQEEAKWAYDISQVNDIYIYIKENEDMNDNLKVIEEAVITDFEIVSFNEVEQQIKIYKPDAENEVKTFLNAEENEVSNIIFKGDYESNMQELKVGYQGGMIGFRVSNNDIATMISDEATINHLEFLKNSDVTNEELEVSVKFNLKIKLKEGATYIGNIELQMPVGDVIEEGITSIERTDIDSAIFKRQN